MASVYTNDLRLEEIGSGEQSGTWGDTTNTNLELIAEAFAFGTEAITTNADTHATTIADGATDPGRSIFLKYTGTLDSACTITIGPNTVSKLWFIENGTSGSQNIIIKQGSGATITIPPGDTKAIYSDGAGSGGKMVDAFASLSVVDLKVQDDLTVTDDVAIGGILGVTGVLTTTAATVFNGGFAANDGSTITVDDNTVNLTLACTDADATVGPMMSLYRNSSSAASDDQIGTIFFVGRNSENNADVTYGSIETHISAASAASAGGYMKLRVASHDGESQSGLEIRDGNAEDEVDVTIGNGTASNTTIAGNLTMTGEIIHAGDSDTTLQFNANDSFRIITGNEERFKASNGEVVVNDNSVDMDFRVESNGDANMLLVDGGRDKVFIGRAKEANDGVLIVQGDDVLHPVLKLGGASTNGFTLLSDNYQTDESTMTLGSSYSGGAMVIARGVKVSGSADNTYLSSQDTFADTPAAVRIHTGSFQFLSAASNATTATDSAVTLVERLKMTSSATIFNDSGVNTDFTIKSDSNANAFFMDASVSHIGINRGASSVAALTINTTANNTSTFGLEVSNNNGNSRLLVRSDGQIRCFDENNAQTLIIGPAGGETVFNPDPVDKDVRFATVDHTHALFVQGADGDIYFNKSSSSVAVNGAAHFRPVAGMGKFTTAGSATSGNSTYEVYSTGVNAYRFYVEASGTVFATVTTISGLSDVRKKENIRDITVGLSEILALRPRTFDWKEGQGKNISNDRGFIAQEFETVLPDLIDEWKDESPEGEDPYKSVRQELVPILVKAIQEQQTLIEALTDRVTALES